MSMSVRVTGTVDSAALSRWLAVVPPQMVQKGAQAAAGYAKAEITAAGRVDTGQMRNTITWETYPGPGISTRGRVIAHARHSEWQHEGTKGPIYPRRASVLRWKPKRGTGGGKPFLFAKWVRGVKPLPFLTRAVARLRLRDFI